ncbi:alpha-tocopherol transfer protein-like isoform X1 [Homarus americanus]|uniref:alpha-tocopherol transfer protein-like isoform X1 n=1 Tax=Homarus americanus TaxID=6706 RepID=UPI001C494B6E|nr:alpha-tocopherol transfer protein-like isoform X1 [Homarus americanus]
MVETREEAGMAAVHPAPQSLQGPLDQHSNDKEDSQKAEEKKLKPGATVEVDIKDKEETTKTTDVTNELETIKGTSEVVEQREEEVSTCEEVDAAVQAALRVDRRVVSEVEDGALPQELAAEAEWDLHEKPEWVDRDVQALREMVEAEPGLRSRLDKPFLLAFLRARKFDYDKAMAMIRSYYRARQENADMYIELYPSALEHVWPLQMQTVLPTPDRLGRTVIIFRTGAWLPEACGLDDVFRSQVVLLEHVVRLPVTQLRGIAAIVDCSGLSMTHAYYLTPTHIRRMISVIQEVFPLRFKALHFVHEPSIFDWVFSLIKPFLSETIKGRLHFHGEDLESLHQHIQAEELPEELGGTQGPLDNTFLLENLKKHEDYFKEHFIYGFEACEEPPRQGTMMEAVTDMGSLIGSYYRRMCID